jgi:DNA polymerase-3 subunit gamma/tau
MAKAMNCMDGPTTSPCNVCRSCEEITSGAALDVFEIDGASNRGINEIRELRENVKYMPSRSRLKVYIIDEVHMLTAEAFNALLKTLEEPPSHVLFFFATTEPYKIPATILSRCQRHNFKRIDLEKIISHLEKVCHQASLRIPVESLQLLAHESGGSMRDALSLLDQVMAYSEEAVSHADVLEVLGAVDRKILFDLSGALLDGQIVSALDLLDTTYRQGYDLKRLYRELLQHFRHLLVIKLEEGKNNLLEVPAHDMELLTTQAQGRSLESIHQFFTVAFDAEASIRFSSQPRLVLEALFVRLFQLKNLASLDHIITGIDGLAKTLGRPGESPDPSKKAMDESAPKTPLKTEDGQHSDVSQKPQRLDEIWKRLLVLFNKECRSLIPSLENAFLSKVGSNFVEITVKGNSFISARLREENNASKIKHICRQYFGRNMAVRVVEQPTQETQKNGTIKETEKARQLKKEALDHPTVTDALDVFQGTVVDVKII